MITLQSLRAEQSRAEQSRAEQRLGCLSGGTGGNFAGQVFAKEAIEPTLTDMQGGGRQPHIVETQRIICAMRGRNKENPSDRTPGIELEQRLEPQFDGICNTLTSVQKDNLVLEIKKSIDPRYHDFIYDIDGIFYLIRIRKLTPMECWRLMDFTDEDFNKARQKVSNTQLYKQAGNSIVVACLEGIFSQMMERSENGKV